MNVKTLCLGVLSDRELSGYEIKKCFEEEFQHFFVAGFGSIYPALADLTEAGLVTVESVEQEKRPDKKVYSITDAGLQTLKDELIRTPARHKVKSEFLVLMYFAHLLPAEKMDQHVGSMIDHFTHMLNQDLNTIEKNHEGPGATPPTPGVKFALGFGRAVLTSAIAYCHRHREQLLRGLQQADSDQAKPESLNGFKQTDHELVAGE